MSQLTGTWQLVRLALRRDRVMLPLWIAAVVTTVVSTQSAFAVLYPDQAGRDVFARSVASNTMFRAFYGPLYDSTSTGGLTAWRVGTIGAVMLGLMSTFVVTRHSRQEEETGRLELLGSAVLGRRAPLAAALTVAAAGSLIAGLLAAAALISTGAAAAGSVALGLALAGGGLVLGGFAAVAAQLTETSRAANGLSVAVVATAFLLRAAGDGGSATWLTWLSPIGWVEQVRAFDANRFWLVLALLLVAGLLTVGAVVLNERRDMGSSVLRTRPGPATAASSLTGMFALGWRLQRAGLVAWSAGFAVFGAVFGALSASIADLVNSSPQLAEILRRIGGPGALIDGYFAGILGLLALMACGYGLSAMLRLRSDEVAQLVEPVLATGVSRRRVLAAPTLFAIAGPAVLLLVAGLSAGISGSLALDDGVNRVPGVLGGALIQLPAVWVVIGISAALIGLVPRWTGVAWGVLAGCALIAELGPSLDLPQLVLDASPFTHTPRLPGPGAVSVTPAVVLTLVAAALLVAGFAGFRRRDIG